nr:reverse transcriptase domain-containing protein [Tanacetum cinerariifolium]
MSTNKQTPLSQLTSAVRNTLGREQAPQNLVRPKKEPQGKVATQGCPNQVRKPGTEARSFQIAKGEGSRKKDGVQNIGERETESCYQSSRSKETEIASEKHRHKREYPRRTEAESESEESAGGHWKSKPKKQKVWFDDLPKESIDSYDDLRKAFLENYLQQKKCIKDPVEIHNIKQRNGESTEEFMRRNKLECRDVKGASECMKISGFMHGITNPELIKRLHDKIPKSIDEMMSVIAAFLRGEMTASDRERKKSFPSWKQETGQKQNFKRENFRNEQRRNTKGWKTFTSDQGVKAKQWERSGKDSKEGGNLEKRQTAGNINDATMSKDSEAKDHSNFLPGTNIVASKDRRRGILNVRSDEFHGGSTLTEEGRKELCGLLRSHIDVFTWKPTDMTGVPRHIAEHKLNVREGCLPVRQKKRGQVPERNKAISEEVKKLVEAGIMKEVYVDDLVIKSRTEKEVIRDAEETFKTLRKINMKLNPKKCAFGMREGTFLGYKVDADGMRVSPDKVKAVIDLPFPKYLKDVQKLNGKLASLNRFLSKSAKKSLPFFKTLKKCTKKSDFQWTPEAEEAFKEMKQSIAELPMLTTPKEKEELIIYMTAAKEAVSAVLMTERDGKQMPIYFVSQALQGLKINYTPMEKLILALRFELGEHDIQYRPRTSVKGQILVDFIVERPEDGTPYTPMEDRDELPDPWILFTDGSSCVDGSGAGLIIMSPEGMEFTYTLRFKFNATNNEAEYKALIAGFSIKQIPRRENKKADALSKIASTSFAHLSKQVLVEELREKAIDEKEILAVVEEEGHTWMTPVYEYLTEVVLPEEKKKARTVRRKAGRYAVISEVLYKKSFLGPWLQCVGPLQANYVLREIHEGSCSMHAEPRSMVAKALRLGYFWPTMLTDAINLIRECKDCQIHRLVPKNQQEKLTPITSPWPFYKWKIDIPGPFSKGPSKVKFLIVAIDYFTKWIEAKPVASITGTQVEEVSHVLWAHRTMIKLSNGETPFSLTYKTEAVIPAEIGMPTLRTTEVDVAKNNEALGISLDLLEEKIEQAAIQEARSKAKMEGYYNVRVRSTSFRP